MSKQKSFIQIPRSIAGIFVGLAFFMPAFTEGAVSKLVIKTVTGLPNQTLTIPVFLTPGGDINVFQLNIAFDKARLEYVFYDAKNTLIEDVTYYVVMEDRDHPGVINMTADTFFRSSPPINDDGILIYLIFKIKPDATGFAYLRLEDPATDLAGAEIENGGVTIGTSPASTPTPIGPSPTPGSTLPTPTPNASALHPADTDQNKIIDDFELLAYINRWANKQVQDFDLLITIKLWVCQLGYTKDIYGQWNCK